MTQALVKSAHVTVTSEGYQFEARVVGKRKTNLSVRASITCLNNNRRTERIFKSKIAGNMAAAFGWWNQWLNTVRTHRETR